MTSVSPNRLGSLHGKSGAITSVCKTVLSDQQNRLAFKHQLDLELIDGMRTFIKTKCNIERDYAQALIKLSSSHQLKKYSQFLAENESENRTLYTAWKTYIDEVDKYSKNRLVQYENYGAICDNLKEMKTHKVKIGKKSVDHYLKKMQDELMASVTEIDKTRKLYFDEEHLAHQARDKEEKIKKQKSSIFSSLKNLQNKKEKTSAYREASDIQSTQARNDYIMALAAGNAHFNHYYSIDLPGLMQVLDDDVLDKCKGFLLTLLQSETNTLNMCNESIERCTLIAENSSGDFTNAAFLDEPQSVCLKEPITYDFEPCDNDAINIISLEHNADIALQNEIQKWLAWFTKECRNLNKLSQQLIKCQSLLAEGQKTVEVQGSGPVDIEVRIEDIRQQIRKCEISKLKAQARLKVIKESGLEMEDFESVETQVTTEASKTLSVDVVDIGQPLSRTPSLRSTNLSYTSESGRISSLDGRTSDRSEDYQVEQTPEPDISLSRSDRIESSSSDQLESPSRETQQANYGYDATNTSWNDYDPSAAWGEPGDQQGEIPVENAEYLDQYNNYDATNYNADFVPVDGDELVGKICKALYSYNSQTQDELSFLENETLTIIEGCDKDWVKAQNDRYMVGYVPAAYLQIVGDAPKDFVAETQPVEQQNDDNNQHKFEKNSFQEAESEQQNAAYVRALYDYAATTEEELSFYEGEIFKLIDKSEDGWWTGEKEGGVVGHFSSMLVEELNGDDNEEIAFEVKSASEEEEESDESITSPPLPGAPPPSFAPPKPAYLTPHQVIITLPTPDTESRSPIGEEEAEVEQENVDQNETQEIEESFEIINADFKLEKPKKRFDESEVQEEGILEQVEEEEKIKEEPEINNNTEENETKLDGQNENEVIDESRVKEIVEAAEEISEAITNAAISLVVKETSLENINKSSQDNDETEEDMK